MGTDIDHQGDAMTVEEARTEVAQYGEYASERARIVLREAGYCA